MTRQVHVEVTGIKGDTRPIGSIAAPPRFTVYCNVDGRRRSLSGVCQFNGILYAFSHVANMTAAVHVEIADKIRASWRDLRILFTGYNAGHVDGWEAYEETHGGRER